MAGFDNLNSQSYGLTKTRPRQDLSAVTSTSRFNLQMCRSLACLLNPIENLSEASI